MNSPIADLTYRNYDGPLEPPNHRWWSIAKSTIRIALKKKSLWVFMLMSSWYYVAMIFVLFFVDQAIASAQISQPGQPSPMDAFFSRIIWKDQFLHGFQFGQICYFAIALILGAGSIANDTRANALLVYLSKPISKRDYILGKWFGIFLPLLITMVIPSLVFYGYGLMSFRDKGFVSQDPWLFPKLMFIMPVAAAFHSSIVLGISSWFNQGRMAGSVYAGLFFLTNFFTHMMGITYVTITAHGDGEGLPINLVSNLFYCSVDGLCNGFMKAILQTSGSIPFGIAGNGRFVPHPSIWFILPTVFLISVGFILLAYRKVRAVNIVG